jgi:histidine triad (HIT) family protein
MAIATTWRNTSRLERLAFAHPFPTIMAYSNPSGGTMSTIFSKIVSGEMDADIVYQDELVTAFRDMNPAAPTHLLIVPNKEIPTVDDLAEEDEQVAGRMFLVASRLAREEGIAEDGYRLIVNCREHGGQEVYHLHMHLLGGRPLGPMIVRR